MLTLSLGTYGCRVVQKAFDHISSSQREKLAQELDGHIMQCVRDQNANHVVQKVIERVDPSASRLSQPHSSGMFRRLPPTAIRVAYCNGRSNIVQRSKAAVVGRVACRERVADATSVW